MKRSLARLLLNALLAVVAGCNLGPSAAHDDELTSVGGTAKTIEWDAFVYVSPGDDDATIQRIIARQVKSALGSLREKNIGISDLNAQHNLDPAGWKREPLTLVDAA